MPGGYCVPVDPLFNLPGVHLLDVRVARALRQASGRAAVDGAATHRSGLPELQISPEDLGLLRRAGGSPYQLSPPLLRALEFTGAKGPVRVVHDEALRVAHQVVAVLTQPTGNPASRAASHW